MARTCARAKSAGGWSQGSTASSFSIAPAAAASAASRTASNSSCRLAKCR
jgi:hypothetical protein